MAMSRTRKTVLIITGILVSLVLVVLIGLAVLIGALRHHEPPIADNSVLSLRIAGELPDYVPDDPLRKILGGPDQSLSSLVLQFNKAKVDKRIKMILLTVDMSAVGWGKSEEIRDAIADFRTSGKPEVRKSAMASRISSDFPQPTADMSTVSKIILIRLSTLALLNCKTRLERDWSGPPRIFLSGSSGT